MKNLKYFGIITTVFGALSTLYVMFREMSNPENFFDFFITLIFSAYVLFPFMILIGLIYYFDQKQFSNFHRVAIVLITLVVVVTSIISYLLPMDPDSSTSSLIFAVLPIYSLIAIGFLYFLSWLVLRMFLGKRRNKSNNRNYPEETIN